MRPGRREATESGLNPGATAIARSPTAGQAADGSAVEAGAEVTPLVTIDDVSFTYETGTQALAGVSLDVRPREIIGIVGPSGCGKSSLLAILAGIRKPTAGAIRWAPEAVARGHRHLISMVFQKDTLLPWLTVEDNVTLFPTLNRRRGVRRDAAAIDELMELAGLQDFRKAYPYQLSGGMRRRAAFITAMVAEPQLLLLDEPFSSLDEPTRVAIHQDVLSIVQRADSTVVLVTHDLAEAATLCDRVVILTARPGRVATEHRVPFPAERNVLELRQDERFLELYGQLWHDLSVQIGRDQEKEEQS